MYVGTAVYARSGREHVKWQILLKRMERLHGIAVVLAAPWRNRVIHPLYKTYSIICSPVKRSFELSLFSDPANLLQELDRKGTVLQ